MKRFLLVFLAIAIVASAGIGAYLAMSIPRDIEAEKLLLDARAQLKAGKRDEARVAFESIIQRYPRTDASAAAIAALFRLHDQERAALQRKIDEIERGRQKDRARLGSVEKLAVEISKRPPPAPPAPVVTKAPARKAPARRTPTRRTTTRRRR